MDSPWREISDFTGANHSVFAASHAQFSVMADLGVFKSSRPPSWAKLKALMTVSEKYCSSVVWIDADCIFSSKATEASIVPESGKIRFMHDVNGINCGFMVFPNEEWVTRLLAQWYYSALPNEINHPWWEQSTIHRMINNEFSGRMGTPLDSSVIIHAAGTPACQKLDWIKRRAI